MKPQHDISMHNHRKYKAAIVFFVGFSLVGAGIYCLYLCHDERPFASEYDLRQRFVVSH